MLSRPVSTGSTPRHWAHKGSYWVAKYYERYFVHWFNDLVSQIFTPWKYYQLTQAKKGTAPLDLLEITITFLRQLIKLW